MVKIKMVKKLTDKGWPTHAKGYSSAHRAADLAEKRANPKLYKEENKAERKMIKHDPHELMSKSTKSGKFEMERKFKRFKQTLSKHESVEYKKLEKRKKKR